MKNQFRTLFLTLSICCFATGVSAATFVVDTANDTADAVPGNGACADTNGACSLRAAISEADALAGADVITLGAVAYTQTLVAHEENANAGGDWDINSEITINGAGQVSTILQAAVVPTCSTQSERVLDVGPAGKVTLTNVTVRYGCLSHIAPGSGGGIANIGILTLTDVTVRDNAVNNLEGNGNGGGIYNGGVATLTLANTTVTANSVTGSTPGQGGFGGGIASFSNAPVSITNSSVSGNTASGFNSRGYGGGLYLSGVINLSATGSHFDSNTLSGVNNSEGAGMYATSAGGQSTLSFTDCTFNSNSATATGSGSAVNGTAMRLTNANVNTAKLSATLDKVTVNGNTAGTGGRAIYVYSLGSSIGLNVNNSTISNNSGGGVLLGNNGGFPESAVTANFYSSTISGNTASAGGGLLLSEFIAPVTANFNFCTIANNSAVNSGGGINSFSSGTVNLLRSIVAGNTAGSMGPDIYLSANSFDYNHIGNLANATITGDTAHNTTGNAMLGPLADNGGPTLTHSPLPGSPVVNAISAASCFPAVFPFDQRGIARPQGAGCDKGAVERTVYAAGPWSLSGVVKTTAGIPIRNVQVTISGGNLSAPVTVFTGNFGTYQFTNLPGDEYTVTVTAKRFHFNESQQVFGVGQNITDADFVANAPSSREVLGRNPKR